MVVKFFIKTFLACTVILMSACAGRNTNYQYVTLHIKYGYKKTFYLEEIGFNGEKSTVIDSGIAKSGDDSLVFKIKSVQEGLYVVKSSDVNMNIMFINDTKHINIYVRYDKPDDYTFYNSPASNNLKQFIAKQDSLAKKQGDKLRAIDSLKRITKSHQEIDSLNEISNDNLSYFLKQYKNFADTVSSPAAFLAVYNNIEFGKNFAEQKEFILNTAKRFPKHTAIQKLKDKTLEYLKIFEEEFNVGDRLPPIDLPDKNNNRFSTSSLAGKFYLIDFWSTWCDQCFQYFPVQQNCVDMFSEKDFQIVSVAVDNQKSEWQKVISNPKLNWTQLIDTNMWEGNAVRTLKFDSIPFNFLVGPDGKVLAKAIKPDSMVSIIKKYIKPKSK